MVAANKPTSKPNEQALRAVRAIWDAVAQPGPNGKKVLTFPNRNDLVYLFCTGFVDETKHSLDQWVDAFNESRQPDGSYLLTEEQWMDKSRFRYTGPVGIPFNPLLLREGDWSEKDMQNLIKTHLLPAVYFTEQEFKVIFEESKPAFYSDGVYRMTKAVKEDMKKMIELCPSPAQVRALGLAEARAQMNKTGTGFTTGQAQSQVAAQRLSDLLSRTGGKS